MSSPEHMRNKYIRLLFVPFLPVVFNSCATITKDDSQPVAFSSDPQGAEVAINQIPRGTTPTTIMVKRKFGKSIITISKEGYETEQFDLEKSVSGMTFGNIIFGGLIGAGVDVATGKATNYQDSVHIKLRPSKSGSSPPNNSPPGSRNLPYPQYSNEGQNLQTTRNSPQGSNGTPNKSKQDEAKAKLLRLYIDGEITKEEYQEMMKTTRSL
ncbi:MAG TPA: hypothetical protein DCG39_12655 [Opitutae bacterium]|nr:hypothetical protein [Opitutae bacterium]|tara:strand:+ start:1382 stop:2014 length:633 start_codon:yes stop_codon:yes gene_type:complete